MDELEYYKRFHKIIIDTLKYMNNKLYDEYEYRKYREEQGEKLSTSNWAYIYGQMDVVDDLWDMICEEGFD